MPSDSPGVSLSWLVPGIFAITQSKVNMCVDGLPHSWPRSRHWGLSRELSDKDPA